MLWLQRDNVVQNDCYQLINDSVSTFLVPTTTLQVHLEFCHVLRNILKLVSHNFESFHCPVPVSLTYN